ncbi:MAG TPA: S41 family peptidase [Acidimicrobiia bacterium]|nr:S41 family peptidase [Acidimicrobiia bacterium]
MKGARNVASFTALVLAIGACTTSGQTAATQPVTIDTPADPSSTNSGANGRNLDTVTCDQAIEDVEIVCEVYELIRRHYVDDLSDANLADAAALGVADLDGSTSAGDLVCAVPSGEFAATCRLTVDEAETTSEAAEAMVWGLATYALDANSVYLDRASVALLEEEQDGEIQGIGALVIAEDSSGGVEEQCSVVSAECRLTIVSTITGSPAEDAGLVRDDVIIGVDGADVDGWTADEVTSMVRGEAGSAVTLTILRDDGEFDVTITRAEVVIPVVESQLVGDSGYVRLNLFTGEADEQFEEAVSNLLQNDIDSLVVDLRDNPGGLLDTAIEVASVFLADGDVVVTEGPESSTSYEVSGHPLVPADLEVVFVVNKGSASASEVVSAVLQERGRVTLVGESTFGKNTVQQRFGLSNGGALKLTIARWMTPGGLDFGEAGVSPDVEQEFDSGLPVDSVVRMALEASLTVAS